MFKKVFSNDWEIRNPPPAENAHCENYLFSQFANTTSGRICQLNCEPRELRGVRMFTGDKAAGMVGSIAEVFPNAAYQRCTVHFYRNALAKVPKSKRPKAAAMLKAIHAMESREASEAKALEVADELDSMRLKEAAKVVRDGYAETLTYTRFPREHWRRIRTNNAIERLNREIRRRTRVVGTFPDGKSALMLVTARLKYVAESEWGSRRYLDVTLLEG